MSSTNTLPLPDSVELLAAVAGWLPSQRWFAAKHRELVGVRIDQRVLIADEEDFRAEHLVVEVEADDGTTSRYQIPVGYRDLVPEGLADAVLPCGFTPVAYDGLRDPAVAACYLAGMSESTEVGPLRFHRNGFPITPTAHSSRVLGGEQSNTSVVYGEDLLIKFFRQLAPGLNPDIELLEALTEAKCAHVAPLAGWMTAELDGETTGLAMASQYVANSADGWSMALTSVRDLFAEADLHAEELGTDFSGEAERLGAAVAGVHAVLAETFGTAVVSAADVIVPPMVASLEAAIDIVPELADFRGAILATYANAQVVDKAIVHRIHGDLHLGQTLRSPQRWLLVDFEGEPLRPLAERRRPDSPLRDVAGMIRSFDYAGHQAIGDENLPNAHQRRIRAEEWVARNSEAFCRGYHEATGDPFSDDSPLLRAYQLDKAVYEATYEARHRPDWLHLPLRAIAELCAG